MLLMGIPEVGIMSTNDEMRAYLSYLVRHQQECTVENCRDCQTAQNVYEYVQGMIFSVVAYPQVAIPAGRRAAAAASSTGSARKASRRAA
jgi:hypothetical protein